MKFKSILVAMIVFFGSVVVVNAQTGKGEVVSEGQLSSGTAVTQAVLGWNFFHVNNCFLDGSGSLTSPALIVIPLETAVASFIFTTSPVFITMLAPACQSGNLIAVNVTAISGGSFSWNAVYTYKF